MNENEEIIVVVPVYNASRYIKRCLDSILNQSENNFRIIIVDDGSTDDSSLIVGDYIKKHPTVKLLQKKNGGAASARNYALDYIKKNRIGKYVCFIDSDDWVHPDYLWHLKNCLLKHKSLISACNFVEMKTEKSFSPFEVKDYQVNVEDYWCNNRISATSPCCKMFEISLWERIRFPEGVIYEDELTIYKLLFGETSIAFVEAPLYAYYMSENSVMRSAWTSKRMIQPDSFKEQADYFSKRGFLKAKQLSADLCISSLHSLIQELEKNKDVIENAEVYYRIAKKKMRKYGKWYHNIMRMPIWENQYIYEMIAPIRMRYLCIARGVGYHFFEKRK